jgi:hypothetical protein
LLLNLALAIHFVPTIKSVLKFPFVSGTDGLEINLECHQVVLFLGSTPTENTASFARTMILAKKRKELGFR